MDPLVFVHVPKTAGTSFRFGVDQVLGAERVVRDYGPESPETSAIVRDWVLGERDLWQFCRAFDDSGFQFITGHFNAQRYVPAFGLQRFITFLRDPVQRVYSEYQHFVRHYEYKHDFPTFYRSAPFINRQLRMFDNIAWPALGMIGFTEHYPESLEFIQEKFGLAVPVLEENKGREKVEEYAIPGAQLEEMAEINQKEIRFYRAALEQFQWRWELKKAGKPFTMGEVREIHNGKLHGWAASEVGDAPVTIEVLVNGAVHSTVVARLDRPGLRGQGVLRNGQVGFVAELPQPAKGLDVICRVEETGQVLPNNALHS
ncbi:hypothetical protein [uncultured Microbulbifer sp.]|uniref:hypothetical protein n=1 Tax=uncultured Microbulbifer sp. TaxID=348147 RepID=UPI00260EA170|nr:hypothetical protein [uncultured Microbulbifer sp.]